MQNPLNPWDALAEAFETSHDRRDSLSADNVVIAWPVIRKELESLPKRRTTHIIDYGCGTGGFCLMLHREGYLTTGIDSSKSMIEKARDRLTYQIPGITYMHGGESRLEKIAFQANALTSVMVMQFIEDLRPLIRASHQTLLPGGLAVTAVFNPEFVKRCIDTGKLFEQIPGQTDMYHMNLQGQKITTYIRDEAWYRQAFETAGFTTQHTSYPAFTEFFLKNHRWELPSDTPEYMILSFRKNSPIAVKTPKDALKILD